MTKIHNAAILALYACWAPALVACGPVDAEPLNSVWECDPATTSCAQDSDGPNDEPNDESAGAAGDCIGEDCGEPSLPDADDDGRDGAGTGGSQEPEDFCRDQYLVCMEQGGGETACAALLEACQGSSSDGDDRPPGDDPTCAATETASEDGESGVGRCFDGLDADCDGLYDCEDSDCDFVCGNDGFDENNHCEPGQTVAECYGCSCVPGSVRDCHVPGPCSWGKSTCNSGGTWGACVETDDIPAECNQGSAYDAACCVDAGRCCENLDYDYSLYDHTQGPHASVGNCGQVCA